MRSTGQLTKDKEQVITLPHLKGEINFVQLEALALCRFVLCAFIALRVLL